MTLRNFLNWVIPYNEGCQNTCTRGNESRKTILKKWIKGEERQVFDWQFAPHKLL